MDYNLYIVLLEEDMERVGISEKKVSWGGESVEYNPRRFLFEDKVQLLFTNSKMLYGLDIVIDETQMVLKVINGLRELEWEVNNQISDLKTNSIIKMLQKICQLDKFSICIFEDDETIDQQIKYTKDKDILLLIRTALKWNSPQNIRIYANNHSYLVDE